jgi:tRNA(Ser,Leu) C12 N-acetylase TAN1
MLTVEDRFNLLLSCRRFQEAESCQELQRIVDEDEALSSIEWCKMTGISSLVVAQVSGDAHQFVTQLGQVARRTPWTFRDLLKIIPIDLVVKTNLKAIRAGSKKLAKLMPKNAPFRVNLHRRDTKLDRDTLLHEVAIQFPGKVDLENYDWIVAIEILGPVTGLALLKPTDIVTMRRP